MWICNICFHSVCGMPDYTALSFQQISQDVKLHHQNKYWCVPECALSCPNQNLEISCCVTVLHYGWLHENPAENEHGGCYEIWLKYKINGDWSNIHFIYPVHSFTLEFNLPNNLLHSLECYRCLNVLWCFTSALKLDGNCKKCILSLTSCLSVPELQWWRPDDVCLVWQLWYSKQATV